jgi:hypothetical protein
VGLSFHKVGYKKGEAYDYDIYKENYPLIPKQVVTIFDLVGYLGVERKRLFRSAIGITI